jgi:uncharacterized glyoxalase superfamily protein PhnB
MAAGRLDAIGIVVGNLADGVAFYRLLGAPFAVGAEQSEHGHAEALLDGGIRLMLDSEAEIKSFDPTWRRGDGQVGGALAFRCESPAAVDELYRKAIAAGARSYKAPWDAFWGQRYAQLRDPDGNPVDLYADLKQSG